MSSPLARESFEADGCTVLERRIWLVLSLYLLPIVTVYFALMSPGPLSALLWIPTLALVALWTRWKRARTGRLRAGASGVTLDGVPILARERIRSGYVLDGPRGPMVRFTPRGARILLGAQTDVLVGSEEQGRALLRTLRLDPTHALARFWANLGGQARIKHVAIAFSIGLGALVNLLVLLFHVGLWPMLAAVGVLSVALLAWLLSVAVSVDVGADGVLLTNRFGARTFYGYSEITGVTAEDDVVLALASGKRVRLGVGERTRVTQAMMGDEINVRLTAMVTRIREAREAFLKGGNVADAAALVARGGRSIRAWLDALARVPDSLADFRGAAIPEEQLWRLVENPTVDEATRAGAAVALRAQLDDDKRARLRVAAETCASPRLRIALEKVEHAEPDELALALDALDDGASAFTRV